VSVEAQIGRGEWTAPERRAETVGEWAERWLAQRQWRATTRQQYKRVLSGHVLPRWEHVGVGEVAREDVRAWAAELADSGRSAATVRHAAGTLARILSLAAESGVLAALYARRWRIETMLSELKTHQRGSRVVLRSKAPDGVIQELYGYLCVHYAIRWLMHAVAIDAGEDPDRLSFTRALRVARRTTASHPDFSPSGS